MLQLINLSLVQKRKEDVFYGPESTSIGPMISGIVSFGPMNRGSEFMGRIVSQEC
jgi:hypothetical protein